MPWTMDRDFSIQSRDKSSGEIYYVDDPEEGYDFHFTREGSGMKTRYVGFQIARRDTPLSKDEENAEEWLDYIAKNPLTECLNYYEIEHIEAAFAGAKKADDDDDDDEEEEEAPRTRRSRKGREEVDDDEDDDEDEIDDEDDGLDGDDDDEEEEEEEKPKRRGRKSSKDTSRGDRKLRKRKK